MPYPVSTLSPKIVPTDLSSFKSRGISEVERGLQQKLTEIRETYLAAIDHFNWNKLIYEADINFEPIIGQTYHLYEARGRKLLSMIAPDQWHHKHLATVRLNVDRQWKLENLSEEIDQIKKNYHYIAFYKPKGIVTNCPQDGEKEIIDLLPEHLRELNTIGRLDKGSEGLILLTDDGIFAQKLFLEKIKKIEKQ